jgi:hypothetical protein
MRLQQRFDDNFKSHGRIALHGNALRKVGSILTCANILIVKQPYRLRNTSAGDEVCLAPALLQFAQLQCKYMLSRPWNKSAKFPVSLCTGEKDEEEFSFPLPPDDFSTGLNGAAQTVIASMSHRVFLSFRNILDTIVEFCAYLSEPIILRTFM